MALAAAPGPMAVVDLDAPDAMFGLATQVTNTVVSVAQAQGLTVVTPRELRAQLGREKYRALEKCGDGVGCAAALLAPTGVKRAVLGRLGRDEKHYLLQLWLIDLDGMTVVADVDRPVLIAARRLQQDVEQAVPPLLRGEREARGRLTIRSNLPDAKVTVNGREVGVTPVTVTLRPGKHEVHLERNKYLSIDRLLTVEPERETVEDFNLLLKPGEVPDERVVPALAARDDAEGGAGRVGWYTWTAAGLTVAGVAVATGFGLKASSGERALKDGYDDARGLYTGTRRQALTAVSDARVANVAWGVAGAAAAVTVTLLIVDLTRAPVAVAPAADAGGGAGLVLGGRF